MIGEEFGAFLGRCKARARLLPGEAQRREDEIMREHLVGLADFLAKNADRADKEDAARLYDGAALDLRKAADKLLCGLGTFDFRELMTSRP